MRRGEAEEDTEDAAPTKKLCSPSVTSEEAIVWVGSDTGEGSFPDASEAHSMGTP